ncbi:uncharacterized protein LOC130580939 [Malurus melanocephalus]|uniref:uncharacterized protein LOC130580939 n=1 Tax=Malurus melanocephalus TaxID=175006 RepID=UPI00254662C2|nr:uncharacterized protein LOC130580939 [Malurus melanocephalus]
MNLLAQVSSSRQAVAGAVTTAGFFLCEGLLGQHFDVVPNGVVEPQPGDLFLFPLASGGLGWWAAHAGIYCGDGEIIHLEGIVAKHGKSHLVRTRGSARVLRRKGGLDVAALQRRVRAAMDRPVEYNTVTCNCIHFALALLGLGHLAGAMVWPPPEQVPPPWDALAPAPAECHQTSSFSRCPQRCSDGGDGGPGERVGLEDPSLGTRIEPGIYQPSCLAINSCMETLRQPYLICCFLTCPRSCCQVMSHLDTP